MAITISKITRAGQITLPKRIRDAAFAGASAVLFEERGREIIVKPLEIKKERSTSDGNDHWPIVAHTMQHWLDEENDNLIALPTNV